MGQVNIDVNTRVQKTKTEFVHFWTIPRFFHLVEDDDNTGFKTFASDPFYAGEHGGKPLSWKVKLDGIDSRIKGSLVVVKDGRESATLPKEVNHIYEMYMGSSAQPFRARIDQCGIDTMFIYSNLDSFFSDGTTIHVSTKIMCLQERWKPDFRAEQFDRLLESAKFSDFKIQVEDQEFRCHKAILSARCPVFDAMFSSGMKEAQTSIVRIADMTAAAVKGLLVYLYTNRLDAVDDKTCHSLIYGSHKYGLDELKEECFRSLLETVTFESFGPLFVSASLYKAPEGVMESLKLFFDRNTTKLMRCRPFRGVLRQNWDTFYPEDDD